MSSSSAVRVADLLLVCLVVVSTNVGCKGAAPPAGTPGAPLTIPTIPTPGAHPGTPAATGGGGGGGGGAAASTRLADHTPLATTISVEFLDRNFYHAASRNRFIRDIRNIDTVRRFSGTDFRIGLILSAKNDSDRLLEKPRIISDVTVRGAHGSMKCRTEVDRYGYPIVATASPNPDLRTAWGDETRSANEAPWRPGETIRVAVNLACGNALMPDLGIEGLSGSVRVVSRAFFVANDEPCPYPNDYVCDNDIVGTSPALELPGRAMVLQQVQLPTGGAGYSAGDLFIHAIDGRVVHENLGIFGSSAFTAVGSDLPAQAAFGTETVDEFSMTLTGATIRPWSEVPGTPKGQRVVTVTANLAINGGAIQGRLAALSDPETAAGQVEGERGRLAGLLGCDAVELVTQVRRVRSTNGRDVKALCTALALQDATQVSWTFLTDRYELPLGLTYGIDRVQHTSFFANATLATYDPR